MVLLQLLTIITFIKANRIGTSVISQISKFQFLTLVFLNEYTSRLTYRTTYIV